MAPLVLGDLNNSLKETTRSNPGYLKIITYALLVREHRWVQSKLSAQIGRFRCPFDDKKNGNTMVRVT